MNVTYTEHGVRASALTLRFPSIRHGASATVRSLKGEDVIIT